MHYLNSIISSFKFYLQQIGNSVAIDYLNVNVENCQNKRTHAYTVITIRSMPHHYILVENVLVGIINTSLMYLNSTVRFCLTALEMYPMNAKELIRNLSYEYRYISKHTQENDILTLGYKVYTN